MWFLPVSPFLNKYFLDHNKTFFPLLFKIIIFRDHFLLVFQEVFMTFITGFFSAENFSRPFLLFHTHFIPCKCFSGRLYYSFLTFFAPIPFCEGQSDSEKIARLLGYLKLRMKKIRKMYLQKRNFFNRPLCISTSAKRLKRKLKLYESLLTSNYF
jgi:hypothetical protein